MEWYETIEEETPLKEIDWEIVTEEIKDKLFDESKQLTWYTKQDIIDMKDNIKTWGLIFESQLIEELSKAEFDWSAFNAKTVIDFYLDKAQNAMKVNNKTWWLIPDEEARMKAMDKLLKIVTGNNGASKWITVNVNTTTNHLWANIPKPWEKLLY